ncbi:hypothetical protein F4778DRAFT_258396 [Xylariomycetidae sp. FL2044]|nr:hypothetical protein F4778DRAFT_258396 [Xylariomycetidae sp. FL2044]
MSADAKDIIAGYLEKGTSATAPEAASAFAQLGPRATGDSKDVGDKELWGLWDEVLRAAESVAPDDPAQEKLVRFVRAVMLLPDTGYRVWDTTLWSGLPVLGAVIRERLNGSAKSDESWVSLHAFIARLLGAAVQSEATVTIWMLRDALETKKEPKTTTLDRDLMVAAVHIEYAGAVLVERLVASPNPQLEGPEARSLRGGELWQGGPGLRQDRWTFWARRFKEEAENTTSEEAKQMTLRAAGLMDVWNKTRLNTAGA